MWGSGQKDGDISRPFTSQNSAPAAYLCFLQWPDMLLEKSNHCDLYVNLEWQVRNKIANVKPNELLKRKHFFLIFFFFRYGQNTLEGLLKVRFGPFASIICNSKCTIKNCKKHHVHKLLNYSKKIYCTLPRHKPSAVSHCNKTVTATKRLSYSYTSLSHSYFTQRL